MDWDAEDGVQVKGGFERAHDALAMCKQPFWTYEAYIEWSFINSDALIAAFAAQDDSKET